MRPVNLNLTLGRGAEEEPVQNTHQNQASVNVNQLAYNQWRNNLRQLNLNSTVNTRAQMNIPQPRSYTTFFPSPPTPTPVASPPPPARTYGNYDHMPLLSSVNLNMNRERNRGASGNQWFTSPLTGEPQHINNINSSNTVALGVPTTARYSNVVLQNQMANGASISGSASQVASTPTPVVANATGIHNNVNIRNMMVREVGESSNGNSNNPAERNMPQGNFRYYDPSRRCLECNGFDTPMWRKGPLGPKTLCNACGIKYQRKTTRDKDDNARNQGRRI